MDMIMAFSTVPSASPANFAVGGGHYSTGVNFAVGGGHYSTGLSGMTASGSNHKAEKAEQKQDSMPIHEKKQGEVTTRPQFKVLNFFKSIVSCIRKK